MQKEIQSKFRRDIILKEIDIERVHEDLQIIKSKIEQLLMELANDEIYILLSTGSGIMKIAWYICHTTIGLNTKLIQILPPGYNENKDVQDLIEIKTEV